MSETASKEESKTAEKVVEKPEQKVTAQVPPAKPATPVPPAPVISTPPVSSVGVVICPTCSNQIFDTSPRVEIAGSLIRVSFDNGQKKLTPIVKGGAFCNIHCFNTFVSRLT